MKLWTPVGLCLDSDDESLPIRICTFGFATPSSISPPGKSLNGKGKQNHSL